MTTPLGVVGIAVGSLVLGTFPPSSTRARGPRPRWAPPAGTSTLVGMP
ncbi:hypothetical protein [Umezawaea tangerina]|nr:hypothetical protein [Umezawaea tangerina]